MKACVTVLAVLAFTGFISAPNACAQDKADKEKIQGEVVKLVGKQNEFSAKSGSLIIVPITYTGESPPKDIKVESATLTKMGHVQGKQDEEGNAKADGGYVWYLFTAKKKGSYKVTVSYTPNEPGAKMVEREFTVNVAK